jgi:hypothetical protein
MNEMEVGTKSVLFGAHCFFIHPIFVFIAWWKLYGFPFDPRLWGAFFVHDLGYWGKPNMDGAEGEAHVEFGAKVMHKLFDPLKVRRNCDGYPFPITRIYTNYWYDFSLYHSRFYAKKDNRPCSQLCYADKLAICLEPSWLYLPRVILSGEIKEYMKLAESRSLAGEQRNKYESMKLSTKSQIDWFDAVKSYLLRWVEEHKDGKTDTWTPEIKQAIDKNGTWK